MHQTSKQLRIRIENKDADILMFSYDPKEALCCMVRIRIMFTEANECIQRYKLL